MAVSDYFVGASQPIASGSVSGGVTITLTLTETIAEDALALIVLSGGYFYNGGSFSNNLDIDSCVDSTGVTWPSTHIGRPTVFADSPGRNNSPRQTLGWIGSVSRLVTASELSAGDTVTVNLKAWSGLTGPGDATINALVNCNAVLVAVKQSRYDDSSSPVGQEPRASEGDTSTQYYINTAYPDSGGSASEILYGDDPFGTYMPHPMASAFALTASASFPSNGTYTPDHFAEETVCSIDAVGSKLVVGLVESVTVDADIELGGAWSGSSADVLVTTAMFLALTGGLQAWQRF